MKGLYFIQMIVYDRYAGDKDSEFKTVKELKTVVDKAMCGENLEVKLIKVQRHKSSK